jgi:hypothetical protein
MKRLTVSLLEYDPTKGQSVLLIIDFGDASNDLIDVIHKQVIYLNLMRRMTKRRIVVEAETTWYR